MNEQTLWDIGAKINAKWIFPERPADCVNQIVDFFHAFSWNGNTAGATLRISADTDYAVWLNGSYIGKGQYSDYPDQKTYDGYPVEGILRHGANELSATVYYNGRTSSVYRRGEPGLIFEIIAADSAIGSGADTRWRSNPCYHSGPIATVSQQLSFTFGYDARGEDGFCSDNFQPGPEWTFIDENEAALPEKRRILHPRPVAKLLEGKLTPARLFATGYYRRDAHGSTSLVGQSITPDGDIRSPAWLMQHDYFTACSTYDMFGLPQATGISSLERGLIPVHNEATDNDGVYIIFDMGMQEVGYLQFDIEAPEGAIIDIGYGEHLDDMRVRTEVGGRNFGSRYICRKGRQNFRHHFLRWAGRYLQLQIAGTDFVLHAIGLSRCEYPVAYRGKMSLPDVISQKILDTGRRTLHLCMHEHYEDTPWREQALYANDARIQALCGYYAFGDPVFPASSFSLLGRGLRSDGFLELTAPAEPPITIPSFTFIWMLAIRDHVLYSGDNSLALAFLPQIKAMLSRFLEECKSGLFPLRPDEAIWHFYDWSAGMSGYDQDDFIQGLTVDAPLNCFLILALDAVAEICTWSSDADAEIYTNAAQRIREHAAVAFWNADDELFMTHERCGEYAQLTQALAVLARVGSAAQCATLLSRIAGKDPVLAIPGLSQSLYVFEALLTDKERYGPVVLKTIDQFWGDMLRAGATTFWETIAGSTDFHDAGSLCHGWSAVPLYIYYHGLLGIQPLEPGFRAFAIHPIVSAASGGMGVVPVPDGEIKVRWEEVNGALSCEYSAPPSIDLKEQHPDCTFTRVSPGSIDGDSD